MKRVIPDGTGIPAGTQTQQEESTMKRFEHTIRKSSGIHAAPAHQIVKIARKYADTSITVACGEKSARADGLMRLMMLGARCGDQVTVTCDGPSEMAATVAMQSYFWNHL